MLNWLKASYLRLIGPARDPFSAQTRKQITLVAFLAWVGLGADGLSSSTYGPEAAFEALEGHTSLALFMAIATAVTVFIIALAYNQVIELFPTGGGGYKVATRLLGARAGLVSGVALLVDYVLTIAISIAAGADALFSFLPVWLDILKPEIIVLTLALLIFLNLRGIKESIHFLLPIFVGFIVTHAFLIVYGIGRHYDRVPQLLPDSLAEASSLSQEMGLLFVVALFIRAYGIGGGTYTGIEAVSNSINLLAEPRVHTGKLTMLYMALSLAFTAAGMILLYLLWDAAPVEGKTLNAVAFDAVLADWRWSGVHYGEIIVMATLVFESGLLFVAANTGFLGGPATLANMATDHWVPHRFGQLSDRLVTRNGVLLMGAAALAVLWWSGGEVSTLVVLYSISVFLTFSLTLLGLVVYWVRNRGSERAWLPRMLLTLAGLLITGTILFVMLTSKFLDGGWLAVLVMGGLIWGGLAIRRHYDQIRRELRELDDILIDMPAPAGREPPALSEGEPAAVFFVSGFRGIAIHTLLNAQRLFPGRFKNFVFLSVGEVDNTRIKGEQEIEGLKQEVERRLARFERFCRSQGLAATSYAGFGTDPADIAVRLSEQVLARFPGSVFFAGTLIFRRDNWLIRFLHNYTAYSIQRRLHIKGIPLLIMPMLVDTPA